MTSDERINVAPFLGMQPQLRFSYLRPTEAPSPKRSQKKGSFETYKFQVFFCDIVAPFPRAAIHVTS